MAKVEFFQDRIMLGKAFVGKLESSGGMTYVSFEHDGYPHVVARFKYRSPKTAAKHWVKFILKHYTPTALVEILWRNTDNKITPLGLAKSLGYVSYNEEQLKKNSSRRTIPPSTPSSRG